MAINKKNTFLQEDQDLAEFAKAISHPARIAILRKLAEHGTCICGEIVEVLPLAQSTVSQHLKELLNAGLIKGELDGAKSCYCINEENIARLSNFFSSEMKNIIKENKKSSKCC
ncbi:MAG: metalloregulator ArsR/SmtB family transcription factor [Bacteroidota bacterium]